MEIRRVVTGRTDDGTSVFVDDAIVEPKRVRVMPGSGFVHVWGSDDTVALPSDGTQPPWATFFPPATGFRFLYWTLPPAGTPIPEDIDLGEAIAEVQRERPGLMEHSEPEHPGMHTTATIDFDVVLSGEVWLEVDNGEEVHLKAGDCVVQNGTRHAWHNKTSEPAVIVTALVGARG